MLLYGPSKDGLSFECVTKLKVIFTKNLASIFQQAMISVQGMGVTLLENLKIIETKSVRHVTYIF